MKIIAIALMSQMFSISGMENDYRQENILPKEKVHDIRYLIHHTNEYPHCLIGNIEFSIGEGIVGGGTGTLVSSDLVLTSAHIVYDKKTGSEVSLKGFTFSPGQSGNLLPFGSVNVIGFFYPPAYKTDGYPSKNDWALLKLDREVGLTIQSATQQKGWFELKHFSDDNDMRRPIETAGYPGEKSNQMYGCKGGIVSLISDGLIGHNMDTTKGQSGSCIWREIQGNRYLLAIHQGGGNDNQNVATLWTESNHQQYLNFLMIQPNNVPIYSNPYKYYKIKNKDNDLILNSWASDTGKGSATMEFDVQNPALHSLWYLIADGQCYKIKNRDNDLILNSWASDTGKGSATMEFDVQNPALHSLWYLVRDGHNCSGQL